MNRTDKTASTLLGKKIGNPTQYNPSILVAVPRDENRTQYAINSRNLEFCGWDVWHCYEFSAITKNNMPVTRVLKLKYSAESKYIVESKSLKLYLNSFNMTQLGQSSDECLEICKDLISTDLSKLLQTKVEIEFLTNKSEKTNLFKNYTPLSELADEQQIKISKFKESPEILKIKSEFTNKKEKFLSFDSMRSNCRVTHQPDFGDVFIYYNSKKNIDCISLVEYLTSFRQEYHFHEECCEMIFKRIYDLLDENDEIMVCTLYTRRGGIDISPVRYTKNLNSTDIVNLIDLKKFARYGIKQ